MDVPVAMGLAVLGAIISGAAFCCCASTTRQKQTLKQLMAVEGVGSGVAVIARKDHKYVPDSEGPGENYYYAWYSWTAQHANGGAFFRVKVDKQRIDGKTFGKLQQGAQVPVRFWRPIRASSSSRWRRSIRWRPRAAPRPPLAGP